MDELNPQGEFHHFQLVNSSGDIPISISVLVHYNQSSNVGRPAQEPIDANDVIQLHEDLKSFDGDFLKAFGQK